MHRIQLKSLKSIHFKSLFNCTLEFDKGIQVLTGLNGVGKTNVLDAIHYLGICKSSFSLKDSEIAFHGTSFFRLECEIESEEKNFRVVAKVQPGISKLFERDNKPYALLSDHIGSIPVVLISPNDTQILSGYSDERRRFIDQTLCQTDHKYLRFLTTYNRLLSQRNAWLKQQLSPKSGSDSALLDTFDQQMSESAIYINKLRHAFVAQLSLSFGEVYRAISEGRETPTICYKSGLETSDWMKLMKDNRMNDLRTGRTTEGVHRDDIQLLMDGKTAKRFSSQGQLKSFVFALKLAQYKYMSNSHGTMPILLLDDLFDKLDQNRVRSLLQYIVEAQVGQTFITDTEPDRIIDALTVLKVPFKTFSFDKDIISGQTTFRI
jgi:DNA replication and repair protein RecF